MTASEDVPKEIEDVHRSENKVYSIQKHDASQLHYDLRLEKHDVLKSWAIPKGPPKDSGRKRLAIKTEDHPLEYAFFEGEIEEGRYGAGTVEVWDKGTYEVEKWEKDEIIVDIKGDELEGKYVLIRFKPEEGPDKWLFFKKSE